MDEDGWTYCESCGKGFTLWYEQISLSDLKDSVAVNGYHESTDMTLCNSCYREACADSEENSE